MAGTESDSVRYSLTLTDLLSTAVTVRASDLVKVNQAMPNPNEMSVRVDGVWLDILDVFDTLEGFTTIFVGDSEYTEPAVKALDRDLSQVVLRVVDQASTTESGIEDRWVFIYPHEPVEVLVPLRLLSNRPDLA